MSFYEDSDGNKYVVGADAVPKKLGNNSLQWYYVVTTNNGTTSYPQKFENLDRNKTYYFLILIPIHIGITTPTYVTNCDGVYKKLNELFNFSGPHSSTFFLYKVENATTFEVKTVLKLTNGGLLNFYCTFE